MDEVERHLALIDPLLAEDRLKELLASIHSCARRLMRSGAATLLYEVNVLARVVSLDGCFGARVSDGEREVLTRWGVDQTGRHWDLKAQVLAMLMALHFLRNQRLGKKSGAKRDCFAVGVWCALSFQEPLREPRLEDLRGLLLRDAQGTALRMAYGARSEADWATDGDDFVDEFEDDTETLAFTIDALREALLSAHEEVALLRWVLADRSSLLDRSFRNVSKPEVAAVARGLELGRILRRFPTREHLLFVCCEFEETAQVDLGGLVEQLGDDGRRMGQAYVGNELLDSCPLVFPLLRALHRGDVEDDGGALERSVSYWCARALLESAAMSLATGMMEGEG